MKVPKGKSWQLASAKSAEKRFIAAKTPKEDHARINLVAKENENERKIKGQTYMIGQPISHRLN